MSRFKLYNPDQAYLLPPSVRDELGSSHLCFFVREVIERLDMSGLEQSYSAEGGELYAPQLMLGVWLYAYALGISSARQVERRVVEDLAFRYLAAGERVDNWALSAFRRRHGRALNDAFTQVLEWAQQRGMVKLGRVAMDSTRIAANACKDCVDSEQALRDTRAQLRRQVRAWQKEADRDDAEPGGLEVAIGELNRALDELPRRLERLKKSGLKRLSRTDEDARFLRQRGEVRARLLGGNRGLGRPLYRGPARDAERDRQRLACAHAGPDRTALRCAAGPGTGRQRLLLGRQPQADGTAQHRRICTGLQHGAGTEPGRALPHPGQGPGASPHAGQIAKSGRASCLRTPQDHRRTGIRSSETTTWNETISHPWIEQRRKRIHPGHNGLQHHPAARQAESLNKTRTQDRCTTTSENTG